MLKNIFHCIPNCLDVFIIIYNCLVTSKPQIPKRKHIWIRKASFAIDSMHLMLTEPIASLLNQSAVILGLVCGSQNLFYPLTNIVSLMLLDEVMEILINQGLKRIAKV